MTQPQDDGVLRSIMALTAMRDRYRANGRLLQAQVMTSAIKVLRRLL